MNFHIELDKQKFREWLENEPDEMKVGTTCSPGGCPIANWINTTQHIEGNWYTVTLSMVWMNPGDYSMSLPDWAKHFVRKLDSSHKSMTIIDKFEALDVLDTCEDDHD